MNKLTILAFLLITLINCSNNKKYKVGDPASWNLLGGANEKVGEMIVRNDYWIEDYEDTITKSHKLLLVHKDEYKTITDSLNIGIFKTGQSVDYGTVELNEKEDPELVALYIKDDSFYHRNIIKAWKVNVEAGKFEDFSTKGIRVKNARQHYR